MKDQYFGDINDYRKYGLLRVLVEAGLKRPLVVWMKTGPSGTGGARTKYLTEAKKWERYDPALFHFLHETVIAKGQRGLSTLEGSDMIPGARYVSETVPSDAPAREAFFEAVSNAVTAVSADVVFLDPDNGLATAAMCARNRCSVEHVYPLEVEALAKLPATLLLYQHWPKMTARAPFAAAFAQTLLKATGRPKVHLLHTGHVLFALTPADGLGAVTDRAVQLLQERWGHQFRHTIEEMASGEPVTRHSSSPRPVEQPAPSPQIPPHLLRAIESGDCIAFVGAGFSAGAVPTWGTLLHELAAQASDATRAQVHLFLEEAPSALDYEAAAQVLRDEMGDERFLRVLRERLAEPHATELIAHRLKCLRGIPFRAILTTNFDGVLQGEIPGRAAYLRVLRPRQHRWYDRAYWDDDRPGPQVVKLHGDLQANPPASIVLGRRDYRRRLHGDPGYQTFLKAVFATSTVLYLGFSFTDAYLNELRSEVLALLDYHGDDDPIAYALVNDVPQERVDFLQRHEGICTLSYETDGGRDFGGFDRWLEALHEASSPVRRLGRLLAGRRLLWLDPSPDNNRAGLKFLQEAAGMGGCAIAQVFDWAEAVERLAQDPQHLVISHWGHNKAVREAGGSCAVGERFLVEMHLRDLRAPVIIFSDKDHASDNKRNALALGAQVYVFEWSDLYREIERVLA